MALATDGGINAKRLKEDSKDEHEDSTIKL
jgi:hypothetical protein